MSSPEQNQISEARETTPGGSSSPGGRWRTLAPRALLAVLMGLYAYVYGTWSLDNHRAFGTHGFDLGLWDQGLWLLSRFETPFVTVMGLHLFGDHTTFFLYLLVPLYWLWPSPEALLTAQTAALALGALPVFLIARRLLGSEWLAAVFGGVYLLHPAVAWTNLEQFHPDSFEVPLVLFALYFMLTSRWALFLMATLLTLTIKEDVALLMVPLGIYVAVRHERRVGAVLAAVSAAYFALAVLLILPHFNQVGSLDEFRVPFGGMGGLVETLLTRPWEIVTLAFEEEKREYLVQMLLPLGMLPLMSPLSLTALGPLFSNLLSTFWYQYQIEYHYGTLIVPVLVVAAIGQIARSRPGLSRAGLVTAVALCALLSAYLWGPGPVSREEAWRGTPDSASAESARRAVSMIPDDAVVSAHHAMVPKLAHRTRIYQFPTPWVALYWGDDSRKGERLPAADEVEYVVMFEEFIAEPEAKEAFRELPAEGYRKVFEENGVVVYERGRAPEKVE